MDSTIINEFNKISKEEIVKFVYDSWWNEKDGIKKEFIINSFRKSGITLKMDGSEDDLFEYQNEIVEKNITDNLIDDDEEEKKSESDSENDSDNSGH